MVNVNIPIRLLTTIGEIAGKVSAYIPADAKTQMEAKGVDIASIDYARIIEDLRRHLGRPQYCRHRSLGRRA